MRTIPFITSDAALVHRVDAIVRACPGFDAGLVQVPTAADAMTYLDVEMPDLAFINFSDPAFDGFAFLDAVVQDPWLHYAGIVGFCGNTRTIRALEKRQGVNLVASVGDEDIEGMLPTILDILARNQRILFQRGLGPGLMQSLSGSLEIHNSLVEANCYANLVCNFLYNCGKVNARAKMHVNVALVEMLLNAIEHGNCGITRAQKSAWLESGNAMRDLIAERCKNPAVGRRRVLFEYTIEPARSTFHIADEGDGFDWRAALANDGPVDFESPNGRGIQMTRELARDLRYNERGNAVSFAIEHSADPGDPRPALFESIAPTTVAPGEIVFREGEPGDHLYYIVKGRYDVLVRDKVVSSLSPDDILMGEMAFLLDNRRTATVRASTPGTLINMSKKDFVEAVKRRPHYGLFLARLLARRLQQVRADDAGG